MIVFGAAVGSDDFVVAGCVERATISVWVPLPHWPTTCRSSLRVWPAQAWEEGEDAADEEGEVAEKGQSADEGENAEESDAEKNAAMFNGQDLEDEPVNVAQIQAGFKCSLCWPRKF